jgi:hypothetical protein
MHPRTAPGDRRPARRRWLGVAALGIGAALAGCYREFADEDTARAHLPALPAGATLTIAGARLGETRRAFETRLTLVPPSTVATGSARFRDGNNAEVLVVFDAEDRARELYGSAAHVEGRQVVWQGLSAEDVQSVLGPGKRKSSYRPRGSGVISIGMEFAGEELAVQRDGVAWTFIFDKNRALTGIVARPASATPR